MISNSHCFTDASALMSSLKPSSNSPFKTSQQSMLKEINPKYSLEGLMMKLKLQYLTLEKTLMLGKTEGRRGRGGEDEVVGWHH